MAVLAYCITHPEPQIEVPHTGLQGKEIYASVEAGLRCFLSSYTADDLASKQPVRDAALAFNRILQDFLRQTSIIPFRFPTVLSDDREVSSFLREHAAEYREGLSRVQGAVQMEVRLSIDGAAEETPRSSGAEYLRARQARHQGLNQIAQAFCQQLTAAVRRQKNREVAGGIRCFFLVDRGLVENFMDLVRSAKLPPEVSARVSGPWPATEFLKES